MIHRSCASRRGVATIWALVVLSVLTALIATTTWQYLAARRFLDQRQNQLQSLWLARSGIERAAARLLTDPSAYEEETGDLLPNSRVQIQIKPEKESSNNFLVTSEARYPTEGPVVVLRSQSHRFRRVAEKDRVRLEGLPPRPEKKEDVKQTSPEKEPPSPKK